MSSSVKDLFSTHCGMVSPLELDVTSPAGGQRRHVFAQPYLLLGRDKEATLHLDHADISRRHAYAQVLGGRLFVVDLDSRAGIKLGGVAMSSGWLEPGQSLTLGPFQLGGIVAATTPPAYTIATENPLEDAFFPSASFPQPSFEVFCKGTRMSRWRMTRVLSFLGSAPGCRVRLRDLSVSRFHSCFVATPQGVWVVDLMSREGTRLNGESVTCARLEDGDTLQAGNYSLRVDYRSRSQHLPDRAISKVEGETTAPTSSPPPPAAGLTTSQAASPPMVVLPKDTYGSLLPSIAGDQALIVPLVQQFNSLQQHMFDQFQQTMFMLVQMLSTVQQEQVSLIREELQQFQKATEELSRLQQQLREGQPSAPRRVDPPSRWPVGTWPGTQPETAAGQLPALPGPTGQSETKEGKEAAAAETVHVWLNDRIAELQDERQSSWQRLLGFIRGS